MKRILTTVFLMSIVMTTLFPLDASAKRRAKPWPEVNLSTLPSVVGMANSWVFEINQRSPAYLADLDKMYVSLAYGPGKNSNSLAKLENLPAGRYGYSFYRDMDYSISDLRLSIYSNLSKTLFGSLWVTYGRDRDRETGDPFLVAVPSRLFFKTAFAWKVSDNLVAAASGSISNYPISYVFALQPGDRPPTDSQYSLPAGDGENLVGEVDLLYRARKSSGTLNTIDVTLGGIFQKYYTKYEPPAPALGTTGLPIGTRDTAIVKEFVYSGAPRVAVKITFPSGSYLRAGGAYYFNLFDYQYNGRSRWENPSQEGPSYRSQSFNTLVPKWKLYADGSKAMGAKSALYTCVEMGRYPNALTKKDTEFVPLRLSLVNLKELFSSSLNVEVASHLTRIFHGMAGIEIRYFDNGKDNDLLDDRSLYANLKLGGTTRFYRNLWWSVRLPALRLYTSEALGSAVLFENRTYIETEVLFLGL